MKRAVELRGPLSSPGPARRRLWLGLFAIYVLVPVAVGVWVPPGGWIPSLWLVSALAWWRLRRDPAGLVAIGRAGAGRSWRREVTRVLVRFALSAMLLLAAIALAAPDQLFDWPRHRPLIWATVLVAYPLLSVLPQEVLYRQFLFRRLRALGLDDGVIALASAALFGFVHVIYRNVPAVALSAIGGWYFADTYRRSDSLALVCAEHALYGALVFTSGLGANFSHLALRPV